MACLLVWQPPNWRLAPFICEAGSTARSALDSLGRGREKRDGVAFVTMGSSMCFTFKQRQGQKLPTKLNSSSSSFTVATAKQQPQMRRKALP